MSSPEGITVNGSGEVEVEPDTGFVDLGVQVTAASVADARTIAADAAAAVIASVKENGVAAGDVRTEGYSIQPQYDYSRDGAARLTGYQVANTVSVRVRDLARFAHVLDSAAAAGGDAIRVNGVRFVRGDTTEARSQARALAMADARLIAEELATAGGVQLGAPVAIEETSGNGWQPYPVQAGLLRAKAEDSSSPIEPGTSTIAVHVTVRFSLAQ